MEMDDSSRGPEIYFENRSKELTQVKERIMGRITPMFGTFDTNF